MEDKIESYRRRSWAIDREAVVERDHVGRHVLVEANQLRERGAYEDAIAVLDAGGDAKALRDPKALTMRALSRLGLGQHEEALADLEAAEQRLWMYLGAIDINRAQVYNCQGRHGEARESAKRAVERMPASAWLARVSLASSCELDRDGDAAERTLRDLAAVLADAPSEVREEAASYVERMADLDALCQRVDIRALLGCG